MTRPPQQHRPAHIALFIRSLYGGGGGGAERMVVKLASGMAAAGHRVDLLLGRAEGPYLSQVPDSVRCLDLRARAGYRAVPRLLAHPRLLRELSPVAYGLRAHWPIGAVPGLASYLRRETPDALFSALNYSNLAAILAREVAGTRTRLVISERNTLSQVVRQIPKRRNRVLPELVRTLYPRADRIAAVSQGVASDLAAHLGIDAKQIAVPYNPLVDAESQTLAQEPVETLQLNDIGRVVSGFNLGSAVASSMQLEMLVDVVSGQLGGDAEQQFCASISRMIIAGNSLSVETQDKEQHTKAKYITKNVSAGSVEAVKLLDQLLVRLVSSIPVDIMPGEFDPANHALPQQPLHPCILPLASSYPTLTTVSNPYQCSIDGVRFLGSSGQTVKDILKYSDFNSHIDVLEKTLMWCHMAPTAPDTLGCYPYSAEDPFIIEECPHVYFAGNMPSFMTKMFTGDAGQKVLLIGVPDFSATGTCALVNLRTLTCTPMQFDLSQFDCDN